MQSREPSASQKLTDLLFEPVFRNIGHMYGSPEEYAASLLIEIGIEQPSEFAEYIGRRLFGHYGIGIIDRESAIAYIFEMNEYLPAVGSLDRLARALGHLGVTQEEIVVQIAIIEDEERF